MNFPKTSGSLSGIDQATMEKTANHFISDKNMLDSLLKYNVLMNCFAKMQSACLSYNREHSIST